MRELREIPVEMLETSHFRRPGPLPYPSPARVADAMENGITEVVTAREDTTRSGHYEILRGVDVWLLAQKANAETVPTVVVNVADPEAKAMVAAESGADPITTAEAIEELIDVRGWSVAEAGRQLNVPRSTASHLLRLLKLGPEAKDGVREGTISVKHAKLLLRLTPAKQRKIAKRIRRESLSSRQVAALIGAQEKSEQAAVSKNNQVDRPAPKDPDTVRLEKALGGILGTSVAIDYRPEGGGRLQIDFHNLDGLDGILEHLGYRSF